MSLYEGIKDVAKVVQQADNVELYRQLLDLSALALDMQDEISKLKEENADLKKKHDISDKIIRHIEPCITLKDDELNLYYCSHCWDASKLLVQVNCHFDGTFDCPHCKTSGNYDNERKTRSARETLEAFSQINPKKSYWNK